MSEPATISGDDIRIYVVTYENGNFHSSTLDQTIAWETANRIGGYVGELVNVVRCVSIPEPIASQIAYALEHPESRVTRERPKTT